MPAGYPPIRNDIVDSNCIAISTTTSEEKTVMTKYLKQSVTVETTLSYQPGIKKWQEYLSSLEDDNQPGQYLDNVGDQHGKAERVVLFMAYLYMHEGLRDEQIKKAVTSVTFMFESAGYDSSFINLAIVSRGRKASARSNEECTEKDKERADRVILPVCLDIVLGVREKYWEQQSWDAKGMDMKGIWLAISLGFDSGLRIGNLTKRDGPNGADHCIRAGNLSFLVADPISQVECRLKGGPSMSSYLARQDVSLDMVKSVDMFYVTSKTSRKVKSLVTDPKTIGRNSEVESIVLDDLSLWMLHSGVQENDELLTRYSATGTRKVVIRKDVRKAIKESVGSMGLPSKNFSTKSLRSGFGTHAIANGMDMNDMKVRGGWVKDSDVPMKYYISSMNSKGALAVSSSSSGIQKHGISEIQRMLPDEDNINEIVSVLE